jgi:hypothetical protein
MTNPATDMPTPAAREGLPPALRARIRQALLDSGYFSSEDRMRGLFTDARIAPWRHALDTSGSPSDRVQRTITCLHQQYSATPKRENALVLLLRVLNDGVAPGDALHRRLADLAVELGRALKGAIFICYKRHTEPDEALALALRQGLTARGYQVFIDQTMRAGDEWLRVIDEQIRACEVLLVLLSPASAESEMVQYEVSRAYEYRRRQGHPRTLPVRVNYDAMLPYNLAPYVSALQYATWRSEDDTPGLVDEIIAVLRRVSVGDLTQQKSSFAEGHLSSFSEGLLTEEIPALSEDGRIVDDADALHPPLPTFDPRGVRLRAPGGAVRLSDRLYVRREADAVLEWQIVGPGTLTTIRAPRQTGKSSLLMRGLQYAREQDLDEAATRADVVFIDLQQANADFLTSADRFLHYLAEAIALELGQDATPVAQAWDGPLGPQDKLTRWMQTHVLPTVSARLVLALDEADRLLDRPFRNDFFALLRAWYNKASYMPLWEKLNLVLVISTEPHLLIQDMNQSPFNVGETLYLEDFTPDQVRDLNRRHPAPLEEHHLPALMDLLGGHPYLTRMALYTLAKRRWRWAQLVDGATDDLGPFGSHLRRYYGLLRDAPALRAALAQILHRRCCDDADAFYRLMRAGLVKGHDRACDYRCGLYRRYFEDKLDKN